MDRVEPTHPHIWYPFTQAKGSLAPLKVRSGQGAWLELADGRRILDCISSWWVNLHGHAHPHIARAIAQQAETLEHVIFAGFTHEPAEQLATALVEKLPAGLTRVFYSDNGSTAVEVALKMAWQYWLNLGQPRQRFLAFEGAYHGDTFGAMSVGGRSLFNQAYKDLLFQVSYLPYPDTWLDDQAVQAKEQASLAALQACLEQEAGAIAGLILEPLVQGAGGMRMVRPQFLQQVQQLARTYGVLLICDEIMTGFGRTGAWFASSRAGITPDLLCLSKGLTGGFLPLAVTVCQEHIYQAFYSDDLTHTFWHAHSYTANPLGCAAALASLTLTQQAEPRFQQFETLHCQHLAQLQSHPRLSRLRVTGTIAAMDVINPQRDGYLNPVGLQIRKLGLEQGLLLRPLGHILYLLPPYCVTDTELAQIYGAIAQIVDRLS
jgi:adenosylmethionine---8-amino-7-oxononanoate aminotransferase